MRYPRSTSLNLLTAVMSFVSALFLGVMLYFQRDSLDIIIIGGLMLLLLVHTLAWDCIVVLFPSFVSWVEVTDEEIRIGRGNRIKRAFPTRDLRRIHKQRITDTTKFVFSCEGQEDYFVMVSTISPAAEEAIERVFPILRDVQT